MQLVKAGKAVPHLFAGILNEKGELARDPNFPTCRTLRKPTRSMHGKKPSAPATTRGYR